MFTEVGNFDIKVFVKKKILRLEVSMNDHVTMAVINSRDDLLEKPTCFRFFQLSKTPDEIQLKKTITDSKLHPSAQHTMSTLWSH